MVGAGRHQRRAIERARELGLRVVAVDRNADAPGLETADEERTIFSSQLLENGTLLKASGLSLLTIFLSTTFGPLQRMLDTTELTVQQWALCIVVAFSVVVIAEIRKFFRRRRAPAVEAPIQQPALGQQAS